MSLYEDAVDAAHSGLIAVLVAGVDADGDEVLCLTKLKPTRACATSMLSPDAGERAAFLAGCMQVARDGLAERHGVTFQ